MIVSAFIFLVYLADIIFYHEYADQSTDKVPQLLIRSRVLRLFYLTIQSIAPVLIFYLTVRLTDNHVGRSQHPYGILYYIANLQSVFLPNSPPLRSFFGEIFKFETNWEGESYIGIASILIIVIILINNLLKLFHIRFIKDKPVVANRQLVTVLVSSLLLLLLSMGYPFNAGMEFLLDWFPIINNFRGIGRFSWPFYFVITCIAIIYSDNIIRSSKYKVLFFILLLLIPVSYIVEGVQYQKNKWKKLSIIENYFNKEKLPASYQQALRLIDTAKYQAMQPLPYYNVGSEEYKLGATNKITLLSMVLSYHSNIPLFATYATNTSMIECKNLIQVLTPNVYDKEIIKDIPLKKPFLIVYSGEPLRNDESVVLSRATKIYQSGDFQLYSISYEDLLANKANEYIASFETIKNQLHQKVDYLISGNDADSYFLHVTYDEMPSDKTYYGKGALKKYITRYNLIARADPTQMQAGKEYIASFWLYTNIKEVSGDLIRSLIFVESRSSSGNIDWISMTNPAKSLVFNGSWTLIELPFTMPADCCNLSVYMELEDEADKMFIADEFLVREKTVDIYKVLEQSNNEVSVLYKNDHFIRSN